MPVPSPLLQLLGLGQQAVTGGPPGPTGPSPLALGNAKIADNPHPQGLWQVLAQVARMRGNSQIEQYALQKSNEDRDLAKRKVEGEISNYQSEDKLRQQQGANLTADNTRADAASKRADDEFAFNKEIADRPKMGGGFAPGDVYGPIDVHTGNFIPDQSETVPLRPTEKNQGFRDIGLPNGHTRRDYFEQSDPSKVTYSEDLGDPRSNDPSKPAPRLYRVPTIDDKGQPVTKFITEEEASKGTFQSGPTADMRNKEIGRQITSQVKTRLQEMSQALIGKTGIAQRMTAEGRDLMATFGHDDDFRTYQDARKALAASLAVAQQGSRPSDADVLAIWLPMIPDAFRDTAGSQKQKWEIIDMMAGLSQSRLPGAKTPEPTPETHPEMFDKVIRRDGTVGYKRKGGPQQ